MKLDDFTWNQQLTCVKSKISTSIIENEIRRPVRQVLTEFEDLVIVKIQDVKKNQFSFCNDASLSAIKFAKK